MRRRSLALVAAGPLLIAAAASPALAAPTAPTKATRAMTVLLATPTTTVATGAVVRFSARGTHAGPGRHLVRFVWNTGDHTRPATGAHLPATLTHHWGHPGTYTLVLTAYDDHRRAVSARLRLTVVTPVPAGGGAAASGTTGALVPAGVTPTAAASTPVSAPTAPPLASPSMASPSVPACPTESGAPTYAGVVTGGGRPLAGIPVVLYNPCAASSRATVTDTTGAFSFSSPGSPLDFVVVNGDAGPLAPFLLIPAPNPHWTTAQRTITDPAHTFSVGPAGTISGTVLDAAGRPVKGVSAQAFTSSKQTGSALTDSAGVFRIVQVPYGVYTVVVAGPGSPQTGATVSAGQVDVQVGNLTLS